ncbi:MAG: N-acetylmannosamine-6-phosphate 2-epimerase [Cyanobacteria bacterium P01_H01_bin.15]
MFINKIRGGLVASCQALPASPLNEPAVITAIATATVQQGVLGLRIEGPERVAAVKQALPHIPLIGLWKRDFADSPVYITPRFAEAAAIAEAGADIIAIDATQRARPDGEQLAQLIQRIQQELGKPVMADIDTLENAAFAASLGAEVVGTTLFGYTAATAGQAPPSFELLSQLVKTLPVPVICEGGLAQPREARQALELGAAAVVVGTAMTGIDKLTQTFVQAIKPAT